MTSRKLEPPNWHRWFVVFGKFVVLTLLLLMVIYGMAECSLAVMD